MALQSMKDHHVRLFHGDGKTRARPCFTVPVRCPKSNYGPVAWQHNSLTIKLLDLMGLALFNNRIFVIK